ncbi:MAG: hypothetical protein IJV39_03680 [Ruminococcus sp.]|nr:hypothetical protein [Ruminococcus sp.]
MICSKCGKVFHSRFCPKCGNMVDADEWFEDILKYPEPNPAEIPDRKFSTTDIKMRKIKAKEHGIYNPKPNVKKSKAGYEVFEPQSPKVNFSTANTFSGYSSKSTAQQPKFTTNNQSNYSMPKTVTGKTFGTNEKQKNFSAGKIVAIVVIAIVALNIFSNVLSEVYNDNNILEEYVDEKVSLGETYDDRYCSIKLDSAVTSSDSDDFKTDKGFKAVGVNFVIEKTDDVPENDRFYFTESDFECCTADGEYCENITPATYSVHNSMEVATLEVGSEFTMYAIYAVPDDADTIYVTFNPSEFPSDSPEFEADLDT